MKIVYTILFLNFFVLLAKAEGTKELMPGNTGKCYVQFNEQIGGQRYFAESTNTDTLRRLYIHIANIGEVINFGFKKYVASPDWGDAQFRIKDPNGNEIFPFTAVPTSGNGYIATYNEASIGPNTLTGGAGGYTPLTYTSLTTGDYYIEFEKTSEAAKKYLFEFFDITVSSAANDPIKGRVWSYAWDLNTTSLTSNAYPVFYVYSADKYVTTVNLNGMQPYSFVIACNSTGVANSGNLFVDRQSKQSSNSVLPQYKIFLNNPDPIVYTLATIPTMVENLRVNGTPNTNDPVEFYVNMSKAGTLEIFLDIDGTAGYQSGGRDVVLVKLIAAGGDIILWDGNDGLGNPVTTTITVSVGSKFATGVTHLPVYDAEKNPNGFLVTRIAPGAVEALPLYWDDSQITTGTLPVSQVKTMLSGNTVANGHIWTTDSGNTDGFGNNHTISSWWNGYEINNLASFNFTLLPIKLIQWNAVYKGSYIQLMWTTATEQNNELFTIERSVDGIEWTTVTTIPGAGNSSTTLQYSVRDENLPIADKIYYRLQQTDFDGMYTYSQIIPVGITNDSQFSMQLLENGNFLSIEQLGITLQDIQMFNLQGIMLTNQIYCKHVNNSIIKIDISQLPKGTYIIKVKNNSTFFQKK